MPRWDSCIGHVELRTGEGAPPVTSSLSMCTVAPNMRSVADPVKLTTTLALAVTTTLWSARARSQSER